MRGINAWIINKNRKTGEEKKKKETEPGRKSTRRGARRGASISPFLPGSLSGETLRSGLKWHGKSSATILGPLV